MFRLLVHWAVVAFSLWVADRLIDGVHVGSVPTLALAGLVLGCVNAIVRPVMQVLAFPITIITLGFFYLVVNGAAFGLAALMVPGFTVGSIWSAVGGALVVSLISWAAGVLGSRQARRSHA